MLNTAVLFPGRLLCLYALFAILQFYVFPFLVLQDQHKAETVHLIIIFLHTLCSPCLTRT